ncbi:methionyl tRNA synthetase [Rhizoctonia solani AG-1 IA]|uniref:methionine--tRNA ligase n=1 Tax=Thanatephorus cucumeris (strain AG1-IA) TaxID=983506 RepID=L8X6F2_THACA|nr:methionyl tRNA synthetase [Rhizoctonia solani AG-1 IA]
MSSRSPTNMATERKIRDDPSILMKLVKPGEIVLPEEGSENILITSALPYCNNVPHLGNIIGSTLSADVFARCVDLKDTRGPTKNRKTLYICGTDEYGTATETQALKEKITPRELCDKYSALHRETYDWFELRLVAFAWQRGPDILRRLRQVSSRDTGSSRVTNQAIRFLADRFVEGTCPHCGYDDARGDQCDGCAKTLDPVELINPRCLVNRSHKITTRDTAHMYVRLDLVQPRLEEWIKHSWKIGKWSPNSVINSEGEIIDSRVKGGLRPSPITRDLTWGVPVPKTNDVNSNQFDAPFGYPSITAAYTKEWKKWWFNQENVRLFQFMGKDNVYFHTVLWPGILLADGRPWTKLHHLSTTEYLNYESGKFSKSRGVGVFGPGAKETGIPPAVWRYYLLASRPETSDSMFSWADFVSAFIHLRYFILTLLLDRWKQQCSLEEGIIPESGDAPGPLPLNEDEADPTFVSEVNELLSEYIESMDRVKLRHSLNLVMTISARGNAYLQRCNLTKVLLEKEPKRCAQVLSRALNLIYALSALIHPFMPSTSDGILRQLNAPPRVIPSVLSTDILPNHKLGTPELLFSPIKAEKADEWRNKFGGTQKAVDAAVAENQPPLSKKKQAAAAKAAKAAKANAPPVPKTPLIVDLEVKVKTQGERVRAIKEGKPQEGETLETALAELMALKASLKDAEEQAIKEQLEGAGAQSAVQA